MGPCSNHSEWWRLGWWLPTSWFFCPNSGPSRESQIFSPQQSHKMPAAPASSCQWPPTRACLRLCHLKAFPLQTSVSPHIPRSHGWLPCYSKLSEQPVLFSLLSFYFHNSNAQQCNKRSTNRYYYIHEQTIATLINSKEKGQVVISFDFLKCLKSKRKSRYSPGLNRWAGAHSTGIWITDNPALSFTSCTYEAQRPEVET